VIHREGINVRYLGFVRRLVKQPYLKKFVLMEMAARCDAVAVCLFVWLVGWLFVCLFVAIVVVVVVVVSLLL
jgi:hypothetical protein